MALEQYQADNAPFPELTALNAEANDEHRDRKPNFPGDALNVDNIAVLIDALSTADTQPEMTGQINDPNATLSLDVDGNQYFPTNNGDGTWTLAQGTIAALAIATYEVVVNANGFSGLSGVDRTTNELTITA